LVLVSCEKSPQASAPDAKSVTIAGPSMQDTSPRDFAGLHNVVAYHESFYSGSVPEGSQGLATLAAMGVRTIISVDGAEPDVEAARALGMRYIHLPIGYNGFSEHRKLELTRATRDALQDGPVYIHCHHGKHRSAGAAGAVVASLGWASAEEMVERMKVSGTSPSYKGLYQCTLESSQVSMAALDELPADFPEVSRPEGIVKGMVEVDHINEHLKLIQKAGWKAPDDHPDLVPVAEAGRMADLFRLMHQDERLQSKPTEMLEWLRDDSETLTQLEELLTQESPDVEKCTELFELIQSNCKACHVKYRD